jgi:hypothetical protein
MKVDERAPPADVEARMAERESRLARDTRTEAQRGLGDLHFEEENGNRFYSVPIDEDTDICRLDLN